MSEVWHRVIGTQPDPPGWMVLAAAVVALVVVLHNPAWRIARNVVTIAHEGGHALAALLTGRKLQAIRLHSDTSGVTVSKGRPTGPGMVMTAVAGYITPSLVGLACAGLLAAGRITALLWISIVLLVAMLIMIRNVFGVVSVLVTGGAVFAISWFTSAEVQSAFAYLATWFLLFAGIRPVFELQRKRREGRARDSDADQLARLTRVPGVLWIGLFVLVTASALALGGYLLIPATV